MNLCFDALDLSVVRGKADAPAVQGSATLTRAQLLAEVGALSGVLRAVGVEPGSVVMAALDDPFAELLTLLATTRLGATLVAWAEERPAEHRPVVIVADRAVDPVGHEPGTLILRGVAPVDPVRDLAWETAMSAGRSDPAGSVPVSDDSVAWVLEEPVEVGAALGASDRYGRWLRGLATGEAVSL